MKETQVFEILEKYGSVKYFDEQQIKEAKTICQTDKKLNTLAKRFNKTGSYYTLDTLLKTFDRLYPVDVREKAWAEMDAMFSKIALGK
jgi:hypothetical protein